MIKGKLERNLKMILVIDSCIRGNDSATRKFYQEYLKTLDKDQEVKIINLAEENLTSLSNEQLELRNDLINQKQLDHEMFKYAREIRDADEIIVAAPYWDLSFPSLLKVFIEQIMITGITFKYLGAEAVCLCKANTINYFTTAGGFINDKNLGYDYIKAIAKMIGIPNVNFYSIEGLDIDPSKRDEMVEEAIKTQLIN